MATIKLAIESKVITFWNLCLSSHITSDRSKGLPRAKGSRAWL